MPEKGIILNIAQKISRSALRPIFKFFTRFEYETEMDLALLKKPLIVAANHQTYLDPFFISAALPLSCPLFPVYFITADEYMKVPGLNLLLKILGCFPACKGQGIEKSLEKPKKILSSGFSVFFFPQGRRCDTFELEQGRPGITQLALETGKMILPVAICGLSNFSWRGFFLRRHRIKIKIGKPFQLKEKLNELYCPGNLETGTQIVMKEVKNLIV